MAACWLEPWGWVAGAAWVTEGVAAEAQLMLLPGKVMRVVASDRTGCCWGLGLGVVAGAAGCAAGRGLSLVVAGWVSETGRSPAPISDMVVWCSILRLAAAVAKGGGGLGVEFW